MAVSNDFVEFIAEQLAPLGIVSSRRMFSGRGLYIDGDIIGFLFEDSLYFKVDDITRPIYEAEGSEPFTYATKDGPRVITGNWRAPERLFDDPDAMREFASAAHAVSRRRAAAKIKPRSKTAVAPKPTR